jgi:hypothetical protein
MSHFLLLEMQEEIIKSDKHEFDVICALRYWCRFTVVVAVNVLIWQTSNHLNFQNKL